jgi:hypothetical protein
MRFSRFAVLALFFTMVALGQNDRGTITGIVMDPANASIPAASVVVRNLATGAVYEAATTETGNYTVAQLPAGVYEVTVTAAGFAKFTQTGITVQVAQTAPVNVVMKVGAATDSVTVTADATLLKTDSSDVSHNVSETMVNNLALYGQAGGAGGGIRNPYAFMAILPGASFTSSNNDFRVNGLPNDTYSMRIEGQEATYSQQPNSPYSEQPGVDGLQEVTLLTSNFNAEYGQATGGIISFTSKSGTNQIHGGAIFDWANEDLNAGQPFTNSGHGHLLRPNYRKNDFGGSIGGSLIIPKLYNGHNKTFFFFNIEEYRNTNANSPSQTTVPTAAMRGGDFSLPVTSANRIIGTDALGISIAQNEIYDPAAAQTVNGAMVRSPFPNNLIPQTRMDPVALKIQALIPNPTYGTLTNNFQQIYTIVRNQDEPSIKLDHTFKDNSKISLYFPTVPRPRFSATMP